MFNMVVEYGFQCYWGMVLCAAFGVVLLFV